MARFKEGQKVVCLMPRGHFWGNHEGNVPGVPDYGPKSDEIVTVDHYAEDYPDGVCFLEYPLVSCGERYYYNEDHFAPLMDISELTSILESEPIENLNIP